jgi:multidrug efflux pump subunit AcrA (membrane-fusion protein)
MQRMIQCIGVALVLITISACAAPTAVETAPVDVTTQQAPYVVADAIVKPAQASDLTFQIGGTVAEVLVAEGDTVAQNTSLARLDTRDLELELAAAKLRLRKCERATNRSLRVRPMSRLRKHRHSLRRLLQTHNSLRGV